VVVDSFLLVPEGCKALALTRVSAMGTTVAALERPEGAVESVGIVGAMFVESSGGLLSSEEDVSSL